MNLKPTLDDVLRLLNDGLADFANRPAKTANDQGQFDDYPIHKIAIWGDVPAARVLLEHGADLNAPGEDGDTALHRAVAGRHVEMIRFLLLNGANQDIKNRYGCSALDDAQSSNSSDIVQAFTETRA